jgi:hypothetical protein
MIKVVHVICGIVYFDYSLLTLIPEAVVICLNLFEVIFDNLIDHSCVEDF